MDIRNDKTKTQRTMCLCALSLLSALAVSIFGSAYLALSGVRNLGGEGVVWQRSDTDCGAAALKMVFNHFNIASDYQQLALGLGLASGGTTMLRLKNAAEARGLLCRGWRLAVQDLPDIPLPAIILLRRNHFVVLDSYSHDGSLFIRDPSRGRLQLTARKLESIWGGEILLFIQPGREPPRSERWFGSSPLSKRSHS
jgi:ABC-type bacteriocin/lantibiotic exporter with double-glycine peptidase domain